jgi:dipeptidyl aminopeptidase/acylaminoacyl peptidase
MRCPPESLLRHALLVLPLTLASTSSLAAQPRRSLTAADYDRAVRMLGSTVSPMVVGGTAPGVSWLADGRFFYRSVRPEGAVYVLVNPRTRSRAPLFDHARLATALSAAAGGTFVATALTLQSLELSDDGQSVTFTAGARRFRCDVSGAACAVAAGQAAAPATLRGLAVTSPDGKRAAFIRDWNLWVRDIATGAETALTTDGEKNFGYATDNAGWVTSDRAILLWSPDSKKIATQQQDERNVGDMHLVQTKVGHPVLRSWKYPLPGDSVVAMVHRVVIDVDTKTIVRLKMPPDFHRSTLGDDISMSDYAFSPDGSKLALASTSRDHKQTILRLADTRSGDVRTVFEETVPTHFESITGWRVLWNSNEVIWNSQRDDWSQLYLYDLTTGALKNKITTGEGPVSSIARIDERTRTLWFGAQGREAGQDPYLRHFYRTALTGRGPAVSLTPDDGDHAIQLSPDGRWIVDTWSRADLPPQTVLRDANGRVVMPLETADISKLLAHGWQPPILFSVKAADGTTDIYGQLFRPTNFDSTKKYPIINNAYPGPQSGSVGSRGFAASRGDKQALAELGFIVVSIDGRGSGPGRSKSFHDAYYGAMGRDNTLPDQVAGMQNLAKRYPWIDIDKAAMWGHSGGGFITAGAMFRYPDFFKVGISESGNHDQRNYEDDWGERYQGLLVRGPNGSDSYDSEANQTLAKNLKGKLLLAHGTMDNNVPPDNTYLVVDALIRANKDFDLLMIPNAAHGFGSASNYMMRRRWDYFVRWLQDAEPPAGYVIR